MSKTPVTISIEDTVYNAVKREYKGQISSMINEFLSNIITTKYKEINLEKKEIEEKIVKARKSITDLTSNIMEYECQLQVIALKEKNEREKKKKYFEWQEKEAEAFKRAGMMDKLIPR